MLAPLLAQMPVSGPSYHASAVTFDGVSAQLANASLTNTDGNFCLFSMWGRVPSGAPTIASPILCVDPLNAFPIFVTIRLDLPDQNDFAVNVNDITGADAIITGTATDPVGFDVWWHAIGAIDALNGFGPFYFNYVYYAPQADFGTPFIIPFNGLSCFFGSDDQGDFFTGDVADVVLYTNQNFVDGTGHIPTATRRKFRSAGGKPMNPTGFPAGPVILFSGNASGFVTNQGSGGAFTLTGSLTNASTSPSD